MKTSLLIGVLLLSSCARDAWRAPLVPDTTVLLPPLPPGKYKFTGPVTFALATAPGAVATSTSTDNRKAGQRGGAAATAPEAVATATTRKVTAPWWALGLLLAVGTLIGCWIRSR